VAEALETKASSSFCLTPQLLLSSAVTMVDKDHYYPKKGNTLMPMVYSTLDRHLDPIHTLYGGKLDMGGCRTGAGTWWPDFGTTVRDFSPGGISHPTEHVFEHEVVPFTRSQSVPEVIKMSNEDRMRSVQNAPPIGAEELKQFRHPQPEREALWKSTNNMPSKPGGRRKCGEASNWKSALSSGAEGFKHGGRMPIFCRGPLLDNPEQYQIHNQKKGVDMPNIHSSCAKELLAAGSATGTSPVDHLVRSTKTNKNMGFRDCEAIRDEMTIHHHEKSSHSMTFKSANDRLNGHAESFRNFSPAAARAQKSIKDASGSRSMVSFAAPADSSSAADAPLPNWVASRTIATREKTAAGGQSGPTALRRITVNRNGF